MQLVRFSIFSRHLIRSINAILLLQHRKYFYSPKRLYVLRECNKTSCVRLPIRTHTVKLQPQIKQQKHSHMHTYSRIKCQTVLKQKTCADSFFIVTRALKHSTFNNQKLSEHKLREIIVVWIEIGIATMSNIALDKDTFFRRIRRLYSAWKVRNSEEKNVFPS